MELTRARANQLSTPSSGPSKQEEIKVMLAKLAIRRQAKIAELEFMVFSEDLMLYDLKDIQSAMELLSSRPRGEGETAFPEVATIIAEIRGSVRGRRALEIEAEKRQREEEYKAKALREMEEDKSNPEAWEAQIAASAQKLGIGRKKVIDRSAERANCPHCQKELPVTQNIRFWSAKELYEMATLKEQSELIAERNRSMPNLPLDDVVDEVTV